MGHEQQDNNSSDATKTVPLGLQARVEDLADLDVEGPIEGLDTVQDHKISAAYQRSAQLHESLGDNAALQSARVFAMLGSVLGMHFKPHERHAPFGPNMVADGYRTAIPEDFRGEPVNVLAAVAALAKNPAVRARLADVCWLLERKRQELGLIAVQAYVDTCHFLRTTKDEDEDKPAPIIGLTARDAVYRALSIARRVGWDTKEAAAAKAFVLEAQAKAILCSNTARLHWFCAMDIDFAISEPAKVAALIETYLASGVAGSNGHGIVDLWRLAARAHHNAKDEDNENRCSVAAAERLAAEADNHPDSAMMACHWLSDAITQLHGIPGQRDRRKALQHRLVDRQADILDEMATFSETIDIEDIVTATREHFEGLESLRDLLLDFAIIERPPKHGKLVQEAIEITKHAPLAPMFNTTIHDRDGKTVFVSEGGDFDLENPASAYVPIISRHEGMRRQLAAGGQIEIARKVVMERYYLGEDTFIALLRHSVFVPNDSIGTYARGFQRFFEGDFVSALYILIPLLEKTIRHVLKLAGHDVSKFNDAKTTQEDLTISQLFEQKRDALIEIFGPETIGDLERVFLKQPGPTIRHEVAHGSLIDGSPFSADAMYACWWVYRVCCLPLLKRRDEIELPVDAETARQ